MKLIHRISVLALTAALSTGCVTHQKKKSEANVESGANTERQPFTQESKPSPSALSVQARCSDAKWRGNEWGGVIAYARGDCDNFGRPTGMANVRLNPDKEFNGEYFVEGLFVDGKAVPGTQYIVRAQLARGFSSGNMTCTNLWHNPEKPLTGEEDAECQFSFATNDRYKERMNRHTSAQRSAGKFTGPVTVIPPIGSSNSWSASFSGAAGELRVDNPFFWSLFEALNEQVKRNARDSRLNSLVSSIERNKLPAVSALVFKGQAGQIDRYYGLAGSWKGDVEFVMAGEKLTAKNVTLRAISGTLGNGEFTFCADNPSVTLVDSTGRSLVFYLTKRGPGLDRCDLSGFDLSNGARLTASKSGIKEYGWREAHSGFYLAAASASSPPEFRFGPLQLMPIWGTVTWPDGRVFDGRFENGKPIGQ